MKRIKIEVTDRHIQAGVRDNSNSCPIAVAMQENGFPYEAGYDGIFRHDNTEIMKSTKTIKRFIDRFDSGKPVKPFSFVLTIGD